jgi:hypothetical protein
VTWKTAREIPDGLFRRAKSVGAERGAPYAHLAGLADRLPAEKRDQQHWMKAFSKPATWGSKRRESIGPSNKSSIMWGARTTSDPEHEQTVRARRRPSIEKPGSECFCVRIPFVTRTRIACGRGTLARIHD